MRDAKLTTYLVTRDIGEGRARRRERRQQPREEWDRRHDAAFDLAAGHEMAQPVLNENAVRRLRGIREERREGQEPDHGAELSTGYGTCAGRGSGMAYPAIASRLSSGFRPPWPGFRWNLWLILAHKLLLPAIYRLDA